MSAGIEHFMVVCIVIWQRAKRYYRYRNTCHTLSVETQDGVLCILMAV